MIAAAALATCVHLNLAVTAYGVPGTGTIDIDLTRPRFARRFNAGPASESEGFDGSVAWRADATGMPRIQGDPGEKTEIAGWLRALEAALQRGTTSGVTQSSQDRDAITFSGFKIERGLHIPSTIVSHSSGNGAWNARVISVRFTEARSSSFAPPGPPHDFSLAGTSTTVPYKLTGGSPAIVGRVDGVPLYLYVDTGGQNVLSVSAAKRLGLRLQGGATVAGGGGTTATQFAWAPRVSVRTATMFHQPYIVLSDSALRGIDGLIGYELFARFAAKFDTAKGTLTLARSANAFGAASHSSPFVFIDRAPEVAGALDDIPGPDTIDTGSSLTASVAYPYVSGRHLVQTLHARVAAEGTGVAGSYPMFLARGSILRVGSAAVPNPLLDLLTTPGVFTGNLAPVVNVGWATLRRWIVVLDYPHQMLQLRDGGDPSGNVIHDRSGILLATQNGKLTAGIVLLATPAAEAGIKPGAVIAAVDGAPVTGANLLSVRSRLWGRPGTRVLLRLGDGTTKTLVLRKYL